MLPVKATASAAAQVPVSSWRYTENIQQKFTFSGKKLRNKNNNAKTFEEG